MTQVEMQFQLNKYGKTKQADKVQKSVLDISTV